MRNVCAPLGDDMTVLLLFAFVAGAGTALSPCVLPVLPALLSAGATGGRRRPFGVVLGLAATFTVTIVGLATVIDGVGLGDGAMRTLAIVVLGAFGVAVAVPRLAARLEAPLAALSRLGPRSAGDGFWSGLVVGGALGFVFAPCAGPILAAVIAVGAVSGAKVAVGLAYALGAAAVLLALALGGRELLERVRRAGRGPQVQVALGALMIATAVAMAFQLDVRFQTAIADHLPAALVNPTKALEDSAAVKRRLADLQGAPRFAPAAAHASPSAPSQGAAPRLTDLGAAPEFTGTQRWFNTPGGHPLTLAGERGHVVLVDFWTYTCINCIRTLPELRALDAAYRRDGLRIVGVHTPEFSFEKDAGNVAAAIRQNGLRYAVVQDNGRATWDAWGNQYWPATYLVDARGRVRYAHFGEGDAHQTEAAVRALLREAGSRRLGGGAHPDRTYDPAPQATPETYLGAARAERFLPGGVQLGTHRYAPYRGRLRESSFALGGVWNVTAQAAQAVAGATLDGEVTGKDVYLVLAPPPAGSGTVDIDLDGRPLTGAGAGRDVHAGRVRVDRQRLYHLVSLARSQTHRLTLHVGAGVSAYAFTFG
jgi:cytochrome c biogenesis protein CcdA/thiol-disulfide isomerase/thioredoxin